MQQTFASPFHIPALYLDTVDGMGIVTLVTVSLVRSWFNTSCTWQFNTDMTLSVKVPSSIIRNTLLT